MKNKLFILISFFCLLMTSSCTLKNKYDAIFNLNFCCILLTDTSYFIPRDSKMQFYVDGTFDMILICKDMSKIDLNGTYVVNINESGNEGEGKIYFDNFVSDISYTLGYFLDFTLPNNLYENNPAIDIQFEKWGCVLGE